VCSEIARQIKGSLLIGNGALMSWSNNRQTQETRCREWGCRKTGTNIHCGHDVSQILNGILNVCAARFLSAIKCLSDHNSFFVAICDGNQTLLPQPGYAQRTFKTFPPRGVALTGQMELP
jgi:hypothetical protein